MGKESATFTYTYSANQQEEIKSILKKYTPQEADKMEQLRRLDQSVTKRSRVIPIIIGILSALVLGIGMCCSMLWTDYFVIGVVVGILGLAGLISTYPMYNLMVKKRRERIAPQIIALSDELMK